MIGHLLPKYPVLWVNTIGSRPPRLSREDLGKAAAKLLSWMRPRPDAGPAPSPDSPRPEVLSPLMYPGFRSPWQRRFNAFQMARAIHSALGPRQPGEHRVVITTLPITADLPERLDVDRWVYYCVDDYSAWPGLDGPTLDRMERELVPKMDRIVAVSETLRDRLASFGAPSGLMTHGIDPEHWSAGPDASSWEAPAWWDELPGPKIVFWGVVDRRLDASWCLAIADQCGPLILFGPQQSPDPVLARHPRIRMPGPIPYADLPALAARSDVLVMPYADLPVTRALQPLKFKEYLATGRPVVARRLPAIADWSDAADLVDSADEFVSATTIRAGQPIPDRQRIEREQRLAGEGWAAKAAAFEQEVLDAIRDDRAPSTARRRAEAP
ncbi:glycosyltransferase [Tautonia sociabilis]|uniref:Glycosyltransferase n=1 Tax=Tautonia sociabilis TaxID=2080755 RepID=A0A432MEU6_9BACT|nr:glycosyltransferase [Tautonia sociabilis]RUL84196.1 glycosyltransferase [Tautonia sociabilis]